MTMPVLIAGIGTAVPPHRATQAEAADLARPYACETPEEVRFFEAVYAGTGVETRHSVVLHGANHESEQQQTFYGDVNPTTRERMHKYEEEANQLACSAAQRALDDSGVGPGRITHLVTVSCTGFSAPGFDIALIKNLGLPRDVARTQVGFMGCHGALNGLRVARAFVEADPRACVLLCAVEMCSLHHQYGFNSELIVANSLFADGAGAVVTLAGEDRGDSLYQVVSSGSTVVPESEDAMSWRIGDHGFQMTLSMRVPRLIARNLRGWVDDWLGASGHTVETIGSWAVHSRAGQGFSRRRARHSVSTATL